MARFPTMMKMAQKVAEIALDEYIYKGKTIRQWADMLSKCNCMEVVRCKDCKYYSNRPNGLCYAHTEPYGNGYKGDAICVDDDDFCSFGERKEE